MAAIEQTMYEVIYRIVKPRWDDGNIPAPVAQLASHQRKTRNAIDLGCGTGTHSIYLAQQGFAVTGVDTSPTANPESSRESIQGRSETRIYCPRCNAVGLP